MKKTQNIYAIEIKIVQNKLYIELSEHEYDESIPLDRFIKTDENSEIYYTKSKESQMRVYLQAIEHVESTVKFQIRSLNKQLSYLQSLKEEVYADSKM